MDPEKNTPTEQQKEHVRTGARFADDVQDGQDQLHPTLTTQTAQTGVTEDSEKDSSRYASSTAGLEFRAETHRAERRLLWKLDVLIIPLAVLLYLSAYLDRGNLGNARLQGLQAEVLEGSDTNYSIALSCFFITYITFSIPGTLLAKAILPSTSISLGALIWSIGASCQAATFNPAGLFVCRLFVGIGEALFGQAMALYFTLFYLPTEQSKRIGAFIGAGSMAGAFGGLISYGVSSIKHAKIDQWRILFLIEGIPSFVLAIVVFLCLPSRPETTKYLTEDQRTLACTRLNAVRRPEGATGVDWKAVRHAFLDWKTYTMAVMYSCMNLGLGSVSGFLPTIIKGLGYSNANAQLYTVPPYVVSLVFMLLLCTYSDRRQSRGIPSMVVFAIGIVGWTILYTVSPIGASHSDLHVRYFGVICVVTAGYSLIPIAMSQVARNTGCESQRAVALGMLNTVGQCLSVLAAFVFPSAEGPRYVKGNLLNIAFQSLGFCLALFHYVYFKWENARRDRVEGGKPEKGAILDTLDLYDKAPGFRYVC
ncbi:major facilitator superfamily domain-containing protein [Leucosporidium creatinivorum]|uniref:Major facilitator superfamily domain-containing protein n=1 Tax=Leucosporidium creatinivorum TaxID=106004 RepID=A0A1Y2FEK9_9BASI|nr:major facilitator superfamily domain-containing protein [Leucosporidium creatinivorum]